jgi:hypothetical protein
MILVELDLIILCLWYMRQLKADSSIALTTALSSATLESKIPTKKEKNTKKNSIVMSQNSAYIWGPGFPREEPSKFHLKLLAIEGDHITTTLGFLVLVQ